MSEMLPEVRPARPRRGVTFGHEEEIEFGASDSPDLVGRTPARMVDEGLLAPDMRSHPQYLTRKKAFEARQKAKWEEAAAREAALMQTQMAAFL